MHGCKSTVDILNYIYMYVAHSTNNGLSLGKAMDITRFSFLVVFSSLSG